jgi:hypothetical protein
MLFPLTNDMGLLLSKATMWTRISGRRAKSQRRGLNWEWAPIAAFEFVGGDDKDPANLPRVPLFYYTHKRFLEHHKEKKTEK